MRKDLFKQLSNKDIQNCFHSYIRVQIKKENSEEEEIFAHYVNEYIQMLEKIGDKYKCYDDNKKYNIAFSMAEKDMLYNMSTRYLRLCRLFNEIKPFFGEGVEALDDGLIKVEL